MKTPKFLLVAIIPPAALLLSHCNSIGSAQSPVVGSRASPLLFRQTVSSGPTIHLGFDASFNWEQREIPESETDRFRPVEWSIHVPEEPQTIEIAPMVVTAAAVPDFLAEDWPSDVIDAELRATWIAPNPPAIPRLYATGNSMNEWVESLR